MSGKSRPVVGGGGIQWNRRVVLISSVAGLTVLYLIYSWMSKPSTNNYPPLKKFATWKTGEFVDIPADVVENASSVKIEERRLSFEFDGKSVGVFFTEVNANSKTDVPILLLHGMGSSSEIWSKLGTMKILGAMGHRAVALDLPGHAKSKETPLEKGEDAEERFLAQFIKQENLNRPVIVSPSMSGRFAIPYLMKPKPSTCEERARAFVPLAPVHTSKFTHAEYHRCEIPVLIVYGSKDVDLGLTSVGNLRNMPNREIIVMEGAGHANYEERPDEWNKLLYNFLLAVKKDQV